MLQGALETNANFKATMRVYGKFNLVHFIAIQVDLLKNGFAMQKQAS